MNVNCKPCFIEPYSDEYMIFDEASKHYILTEKALMERVGINLRARLARGATVSPEAVIDNFNRTVSDMIYEYIHEFSVDNCRQDWLIAHTPTLRAVIFDAMKYQAIYVAAVGNLYLSPKPEERKNAIDHIAIGKLNTVVPEIGHSILYGGVI